MKAPGGRRALRNCAAAAAALALAGAAGAALEAALDENVISACRNKSTGVLRVPSPGASCKGDEQPLAWNVRGVAGPVGPTGPAGPASLSALAGSPCTTAAGSWGTIAVRTAADGVVSFLCRAATYPDAPPELVLNEIDYDQVGAGSGGFVELLNVGRGTADLGGLALVLVDGETSQEYDTIPLSGTVLAEQFHVVPVDADDGSPDGVALVDTFDGRLIDALSYEGRIDQALIGGLAYSLVEGTALPASVADSDTVSGSLARIPNGSDTDDAASDWQFTTLVTPGNPNYPSG
jgi:hypothetical protein